MPVKRLFVFDAYPPQTINYKNLYHFLPDKRSIENILNNIYTSRRI